MKDELNSLYGVSANLKKNKTLSLSILTREQHIETHYSSEFFHFYKSSCHENLTNNSPTHQNDQIVSEITSNIPQLSRAKDRKFAKFPSKAGPTDWIKIPCQRQVDPEEYEEFLNLGKGGVFDLDLDRVLYEDRKWLDPKNDFSDFFNYGHTIETWRTLCDRIKSFRVELQHSLPISRYCRGHGLCENEIDNGCYRGTWNHQSWIPKFRERSYEKSFDFSVQIIPYMKKCGSKIRKLCSVQQNENIINLSSIQKSTDYNLLICYKKNQKSS